jgi:hypothetical protein
MCGFFQKKKKKNNVPFALFGFLGNQTKVWCNFESQQYNRTSVPQDTSYITISVTLAHLSLFGVTNQ